MRRYARTDRQHRVVGHVERQALHGAGRHGAVAAAAAAAAVVHVGDAGERVVRAAGYAQQGALVTKGTDVRDGRVTEAAGGSSALVGEGATWGTAG